MTNFDRIIEQATDVLGDADKAHDWVEKMSATLGGIPAHIAETDEGRDRVLLHLAGISRHHFKD